MHDPKDRFDEWFIEDHSSSPEWEIESDSDDLDEGYREDDAPQYGILTD